MKIETRYLVSYKINLVYSPLFIGQPAATSPL